MDDIRISFEGYEDKILVFVKGSDACADLRSCSGYVARELERNLHANVHARFDGSEESSWIPAYTFFPGMQMDVLGVSLPSSPANLKKIEEVLKNIADCNNGIKVEKYSRL